MTKRSVNNERADKPDLYVLKVLNAMNTYFRREDNHHHLNLSMVYCNECAAITPAVGSYYKFRGNDCLGPHYDLVNSPKQCNYCHTTNLVEISVQNMLQLKEHYRDAVSEIILNAIDKGLEKIDHISGYNGDLPEISKNWKRLGKKDKLKQISDLLTEQQKLLRARKRVKALEDRLIV